MSTYRTSRDGDAWLALGDGTRRAIVERLAQGPSAVGELARELPVSRPAVSQHLRVLKCAGLVRDRAAGTRRVYQLDPTGLEVLRADLDRFWSQALAGYARKVDESVEESKHREGESDDAAPKPERQPPRRRRRPD
ncbi:metalloregulator ArsR/SmtB family transcription factor [Mycobacterium sp.]|uniref:ArsR/SmtB family transcription factor n=1 Tax=Mycobacterium sp. TaxID=1785 RepID=UPI0025E2ED22|nr:metalloregulator ArsR/SmtB family transcription factor [Mycobacterium sp.]MBW0014707.1 winged helix-turn-helix transcriptional regulator [Mycobacterium sp.]